jgi:hypothetical protein
MRFALSRLLALTVFGAYAAVGYVTFRSHMPALLVTTIFVGAFVLHLGTKGICEWGEGRPFDMPRRLGFVLSAILIVTAVVAYLWLPR